MPERRPLGPPPPEVVAGNIARLNQAIGFASADQGWGVGEAAVALTAPIRSPQLTRLEELIAEMEAHERRARQDGRSAEAAEYRRIKDKLAELAVKKEGR